MVERVQSKGDKHLPNLFHFALIKMLVLHELGRRKMFWDGFFSTLGLLVHADISSMEENEEEPKVEETVKEPMRGKSAAGKGKGKIQVAEDEARFLHRLRARFRIGFSTKKLIEEPTPQNTVHFPEDMPIIVITELKR